MTAVGDPETTDAIAALHRVTTDTDRDLGEKLTAILDVGVDYLDVDYGFVTHITGDEMRVEESVGGHPLLEPGETCPLDESYCRNVVDRDALVAFEDATADLADDPGYERFGLGCYIGSKLLVDGDFYGTLCFAGDDPYPEGFDERERRFVDLCARLAAYEIQHVRARERLERQNDRLAEFASVLSHDLRNPLNIALGTVQTAAETGDVDDLDRAERALERMDDLISNLLTLARHGDSAHSAAPVDLDAVARDAWGVVDTGDATLAADTDATVTADPSRLQQLLENLFRNSIEHAGDDAAVTLGRIDADTEREPADESARTGPSPADASARTGFFVADDGPGIPPEHRDAALDGESTNHEGAGLGLRVVHRIAAEHGWTMRIRESESGGARFEFLDVELQ
ncbi:sensor histidine kinase [Halocalculus aciditolerans]|uniref:histidine kinase n=1 Tax=Halocalculus aciditolerans TaxID=1383812 RepID=A0A830F7Q0_9EURY|nr:GAF domain-containing sensor histidine kinase [Halocalculus aciditolerans]GGL62897.1 hypothetical protein GCM10009039_21020 [Halocalculus aciditolerans]